MLAAGPKGHLRRGEAAHIRGGGGSGASIVVSFHALAHPKTTSSRWPMSSAWFADPGLHGMRHGWPSRGHPRRSSLLLAAQSHVHGAFVRHSRSDDCDASMRLTLPALRLHARELASNLPTMWLACARHRGCCRTAPRRPLLCRGSVRDAGRSSLIDVQRAGLGVCGELCTC